ncbi:MAG TPA: amidohydrolase, partial [Acidobacteriota bacterium]
EGSAMSAGVEAKLTVQGGSPEILVNMTGEKILDANLRWLGPPKFNAEEQAFAKAIQKETGVKEVGLSEKINDLNLHPGEPEGGSTDVADVSWVIPIIHLSVTTAAADAPWHAWPVVATGGMSIGHKGMMYASKALAATMIDLYQDPKKVEAVKKEFAQKKGDVVYKGYIPDGPPKALNNK